MKATHIMMSSEKHYLAKGEKVYILESGLRGRQDVKVQSIKPTYGAGRWYTEARKLRILSLENK